MSTQAPWEDGPEEAPRKGALSVLGEAVADLGDTITNLVNRLEGVLIPFEETNAPAEKGDTAETAVRDLAERVRWQDKRIRRLIERIDL